MFGKLVLIHSGYSVMKSFFAFTLAAFFASTSLAQDQSQQTLSTQGWVKQNSGTTNGLSGVKFTSRDTGWVASGGGVILRTIDGGLHWNQFSVPDPLGVTCIEAVDGKTAWCADGDSHGNMFFTNDGGQSWSQQVTNSQPEGVTAISFPTRQNGFGVGHSFLIKTTNGGQAWTKYDIEGGDYHAVHFLDSQNGLIAGDGILLRVLLGGPARIKQIDTTFGIASLYGCWLATESREFAVGEQEAPPGIAIIARTTNAGVTWERAIIPDPFKLELFNAIVFTDSLHGTVVGTKGAILHTTDGGDSWTIQASGVKTELGSVSFSDSLNGTIVGELGIILRTTNGGYSWVKQEIPQPLEVRVSPEPFTTKTTLSYSIPKAAKVDVKLYDMTGKEVYHLESNGIQSEGRHSIELSGAGLSAGVYYFILVAGTFTGMGKVTKIVP